MDNSTIMQELTGRDELYYNAVRLFFTTDFFEIGINAIVNTIEFDNEHDHVCRFLDVCAIYLTEELLKMDRLFDPESSKLEQLSEYDYGFTVLDTKHLWTSWQYVEDSYSLSRKWDDDHEYGDYLKYQDTIRVQYNIDFAIQDFVYVIVIFADIERDENVYKCIGATVSSSINITGNKAIVKLYGESMSKTLFQIFKSFITNEKDFLCPVSDDGHLCFCRQLRVCCCR